MDGIDLLRHQVKDSYAWLEMTLEDVTEEQANWQPPRTANPIGALYAHLMIGADTGINSQLYGTMPVIAGRFGGEIGISEMPPFGKDWGEWASFVRVNWEPLRAYGREVRKSIEGHLQSLSKSELGRPIDMSFAGLGTWHGLDLYNLHGINHVRIHGGEIACLKGLQGGRGWSQGPVYRD